MNLLPVYAVYLCTFGLAAYSKLAGPGVPDWFNKQFGPTFLNAFPGALALNFYFIASLEALAFAAFFFSLVKGEFRRGQGRTVLRAALYLSQCIFIILGFGTRLTADFPGTFQLFGYFALTHLISRSVEMRGA